jgi:hypothetical protein
MILDFLISAYIILEKLVDFLVAVLSLSRQFSG